MRDSTGRLAKAISEPFDVVLSATAGKAITVAIGFAVLTPMAHHLVWLGKPHHHRSEDGAPPRPCCWLALPRCSRAMDFDPLGLSLP